MPAFDYWDIDDILAEELEVTLKPCHDIVGGGMLMQTSTGAAPKDLKKDTKVQVPFWLAKGLVRRNENMFVELPQMFGPHAQEDIKSDAPVCLLGEKSQYYFEVGTRLAALLKQNDLQDALYRGLAARWKEIVSVLSKMGVPRPHYTPLNPGLSLFPQTLTAVETDMLYGGREAEGQFKRWVGRFAVFESDGNCNRATAAAALLQSLKQPACGGADFTVASVRGLAEPTQASWDQAVGECVGRGQEAVTGYAPGDLPKATLTAAQQARKAVMEGRGLSSSEVEGGVAKGYKLGASSREEELERKQLIGHVIPFGFIAVPLLSGNNLGEIAKLFAGVGTADLFSS